MSERRSPRSIYPDLAGKVALVTGSSRGIGAETARQLAASKVKVVVNGRQPEAVELVVAEINASGGAAIGCVADCTKADQLEGMRPGETRTVTLHLAPADLSFWSPATHQRAMEASAYDVWVGDSSTATDHAQFDVQTAIAEP